MRPLFQSGMGSIGRMRHRDLTIAGPARVGIAAEDAGDARLEGNTAGAGRLHRDPAAGLHAPAIDIAQHWMHGTPLPCFSG